ncbi:hypothetical protein SR39_08205, partial [Methylobacterium radiotolerans]
MSRAQAQSRCAASTPRTRPSGARTGAATSRSRRGSRAAARAAASSGGHQRLEELGRVHVAHVGARAAAAEVVATGDVRALQGAGAGDGDAPVGVDQPDDRVGRVGRLEPLHHGALGGRSGSGIAQTVRGGGDLDVAPALEHPDIEAPGHLPGDLDELPADLRLEPAGRLPARQGGERQGRQEAERAETQGQHDAQ